MLPAELLRHILYFLEDVECFETVGFQPSSHRYQVESRQGRQNIQTKSALLLVSRLFYELALELAWSWVMAHSSERLLWLDAVMSGVVVPASLRRLQDHHTGTIGRTEAAKKGSFVHPGLWIRRLDVQIVIAPPYDDSPIPLVLARILRSCSNLRVYVSDFTVVSVDCQRTSIQVLDALKSLRFLTRIDFAGHESPSLEDYINLLPHLRKLQQWTTGRIAPPRLDDDEIVGLLRQKGLLEGDVNFIDEETRTHAMSLPNLTALQVSHRPLYSSLRLFAHMDLPSLTHISFRHLDFHAPRIDSLFRALGHQFTHLYTHDIRTPTEPFGYAHVLAICPNLQHLTFSPRLRDDRYQQQWNHSRLRTLGLRSVLPTTIPEEQQLTDNIGFSVQLFLVRVLEARARGTLPSLMVIRIEDYGDAALEYQRKYGKSWGEHCRKGFIRLEDATGRRIPDDLPTGPITGMMGMATLEEVWQAQRKQKRSILFRRIFSHVAGKIQKRIK